MQKLRIGITERGDAALDLSWVRKQDGVSGLILITKNVADKGFQECVLNKLHVPAIIHCTCTGMGGTEMEPEVVPAEEQLKGLLDLINKGFPAERCVVRIDPVLMPEAAESVIIKAKEMFPPEILKKMRFRISLMDIYPHARERCGAVKEKLEAQGKPVPVQVLKIAENKGFQLPAHVVSDTRGMLEKYPEITFETCAEPRFNGGNIEHTGCVSVKDLGRMEIRCDTSDIMQNPQNRNGCLCLACKTELLNARHRCGHGCMYCYWKD